MLKEEATLTALQNRKLEACRIVKQSSEEHRKLTESSCDKNKILYVRYLLKVYMNMKKLMENEAAILTYVWGEYKADK